MQRFLELAPEEFAAALAADPRPFVVDLRPAPEFEAGHVPRSRSIPVHELTGRRHELPPSRTTRILLVGEPGRRIEAAAAWFAIVGYADVGVLAGGFAAWRGDVERGPSPPPAPRGPELRVL